MTRRKYVPGDTAGVYTILDYVDNNKYKCRCNLCGAEVEVFTSNILRQRMCRYCRTKYNIKPRTDLTGRCFGRLSVIRSIEINGHIAWECLCKCGNTTVVKTDKLMSGHTSSCGCYRRDRTSDANTNDLTGMRFGKLTVSSRTDGHLTPAGQVLSEYICLCDCGKTTRVLAMNLMSGNTKSCGCIGSSLGEVAIADFLDNRGLIYQKEYSFPDLKNDTGYRLRFDFAIFDHKTKKLVCLIEFNGEQHYYETDKPFGALQRNLTDDMKREYCNKNNIKLFIIRFDDDIETKLNEIVEKVSKIV